MPENLLEPDAPSENSGATTSTRPNDVPEKFWDAEKSEIRVDALLKSYRELERKLSKSLPAPEGDEDEEGRTRLMRALGWPESPDAYAITPKHALTASDPEVNAMLHAAGFTPRQAQLVYDLAAQRLLPLIADAAAEFEADKERGRLAAQFGGPEKFAEIARQIGAWGRANLAPSVFEALAATADGVLAMHRMMEKGEPKLAPRADAGTGSSDEAELRKMMRDPRYWQKREPDFVARVTDGFKRLFPNG